MAGPTESTSAPANPDVTWAVDEIRRKLPARQRACRYYEGDHPLNFATEKFRNTFGELFQELSDNLCDDVVDEPTDRLQIDNWGGAHAQAAQEWWEDQRGDSRSGAIHQRAHREGDGFAIVWDVEDDGEPRLYVQDPQHMAVRYSTTYPDRLELAAKCWPSGKGYRLNLYYPAPMNGAGKARIEHYYSKGADTRSGERGIPAGVNFKPYSTADVVAPDGTVILEGQEWYEEHDHGMPVFHFPNGEMGAYGKSALHDVYPLQDALNKSVCDMLVTSEGYAQPHRYASGIEVPRDPVTGLEISPFKDGKNVWWTKNENARFGSFPAAEVGGFLEMQRALRIEIARKGGLPAHTVDIGSGGTPPSGLSLLIAEGKLIKRCKDRSRDWGVVWRELMAYALSWVTPGSITSKDIELEWAAFETRDEQALAETIMLKRELGVPEEQGLEELGYKDTQIAEWQSGAEQAAANAADQENAMAGGRISTPPPGGVLNLPATPVPPGGAARPTPAGAA